MKKYLFLFAFGLFVSACSHPEVELVDFENPKIGDNSAGFCPTSVSDVDFVLENGEVNPKMASEPSFAALLEEQNASAKSHINSVTLTQMVMELIDGLESRSIRQIAGTYRSVDHRGDSVTLSGKIFLPKTGKIHQIIVASHYTVCANSEAPSEGFSMEGIFATLGYAVIMPDYLGYGITKNRIHPYLHQKSTTQSVIDMAIAGRSYLETIGLKPEKSQILLIGYSQGGATTMAVLDKMQRSYADQFTVEKVYAGGGPYDLAATYDLLIKRDLTGIPCAVPMIIQGLNEGDDLKLEPSFFFRERLLDNIDEWINSKKYSVAQINRMMNVKRLSELLTPEGIDRTKPQTYVFYQSLQRNSVLNIKPDPQTPMFVFHSINDETVPFENSLNLQQAFRNNGVNNVEYQFDYYGSHVNGALKFILAVSKKLKQSQK